MPHNSQRNCWDKEILLSRTYWGTHLACNWITTRLGICSWEPITISQQPRNDALEGRKMSTTVSEELSRLWTYLQCSKLNPQTPDLC